VARVHELGWTSGLRAVCAVTVLVYHGVLTPLPDGLPGRGQLFIQALALLAHGAVLVFVILSGYLLGRSWLHRLEGDPTGRPVFGFLARRTWRLLPPYWAALALAVLAMLVLGLDQPSGTHWDTGLPLTWPRLVVDTLLVSDFAGQTPLSHQLWTVPVEYHLYLTAPLIALLARGRTVAALACLGTVATVALAPGFSSPFFFFAFVSSFWVGGQARRSRQDPGDPRPSLARVVWPLVVLASLQLVMVVLLGELERGPRRFFVADTVGWVVVLLWLVSRDMGAAERERPPLDVRILQRPVLAYLGLRSYSFYLLHALALELCWRGIVVRAGIDDRAQQVVSVLVLGFVATAAATEVMWRCVELPSMTRAHRAGAPTARSPGP
jgi:peptidoglycan/LPS O-acetylase OafA/YrhL